MPRIHKVREKPTNPITDDVYLVKKTQSASLSVSNYAGTDVLELGRNVTLEGPTSLFHTEVGTYKIKGYSDRKSYSVSSGDGTVTRTGDTITFVVTNTALNAASFTVNGRVFTVQIKAIAVVAPTIVVPVDGSSGLPTTNVVVQATPFAINYAGVTDTHLSADWEVATDPNFTNIVASSYNDTVNLTSFTITA